MKNTLQSKPATGDLPEVRFRGRSVSRGIAIGRVICLHGQKRQFYRIDVDRNQIKRELRRLHSAVERSVKQLRKLSASRIANLNDSASDIFGVQLLMLEGSSLITNIESEIHEQRVNAEWAVKTVAENYLARQKLAENEHLREKYLDVEDVSERLLAALEPPGRSSQRPGPESIIVAQDMWPSTLIEIADRRPKAIITETGGWTSHTSILARGLNLPAVTGIGNVFRRFSNGDHVIVDGLNGQVILNPTSATIAQFTGLHVNEPNPQDSAAEPDAVTRLVDGHEIIIRCNVDKPEDYLYARSFGVQGVGLYRSEFLFSQTRGFPSEMKQIDAYAKIADATGSAGVKIRTFDVGSDQLAHEADLRERNPSLGLRSIRFGLRNTKYFRAQIRALLQASHGRNIDIVFPMISGVEEILNCRKLIDGERAALLKRGVPVGTPGLGAMIEIPSAVLMARELARHVDFLCLGTNDLVQYLLAADRDNEAVADWYQTLHPAVIKAMKEVIGAAETIGIPAIVCGEIAGSVFYVPVLIGLGARDFSMNVNSIPVVRRLLSGIAFEEARLLVKEISMLETAGEIEHVIRGYYLEHWSHLFPPGILSAH